MSRISLPHPKIFTPTFGQASLCAILPLALFFLIQSFSLHGLAFAGVPPSTSNNTRSLLPKPHSAPLRLARRKRRRGSRGKRSKKNLPSTPIQLNSATASDLIRLPRIGKKTAARILKLRTELGGFSSVNQLLKVRGIGKKTLAKIAPYLQVDTSGNSSPHTTAPVETSEPKPRTRRRRRRSRRKKRRSRRRARYRKSYHGTTTPHDSAPSSSSNSSEPPARRRFRGSGKGNCHQRWTQQHPGSFTKININVATLQELGTLPCIGKKRAQALLSIRQTMGPYLKLKDLYRVSAIGKKIIGWLEPHVEFQIDINKATVQQLIALKVLKPRLCKAIVRYRQKNGPFLILKEIMRAHRMPRSYFEKIRPLFKIEQTSISTWSGRRRGKKRTRRRRRRRRKQPTHSSSPPSRRPVSTKVITID